MMLRCFVVAIIAVNYFAAAVDARPRAIREEEVDDVQIDIGVQRLPAGDHEGYDLLLTIDQFQNLHDVKIDSVEGRCLDKNGRVPFSIPKPGFTDSAEECLEWCVNINVMYQIEFGACEVYDTQDHDSFKCRALFANSLSNPLQTDTTTSNYVCFPLRQKNRRQRKSSSGLDSESRRALRDGNLWPDNTIPYTIVTSGSNSWGGNGKSQSQATNNVLSVIATYNQLTNVRFVPRTTQSRYVVIGYFGGGCSSYVGNVFAGQQITLGWCWNSIGSIIHEFAHAAGVYHEQSRRDRDDYLDVGVNASSNNNFDIQGNTDSRDLLYDFGSIMHYPLSTYWNPGYVIMTKTPLGEQRHDDQQAEIGTFAIGQRSVLSDLDIQGLALLYPPLASQSPTTSSPTPTPTTPAPTAQPTTSAPTIFVACHYASKGKKAVGSESCDDNDVLHPFRCCSDSVSQPSGNGWSQRSSGKDGGDCPWVASEKMGTGFTNCPGPKTWSEANQYCMDTGALNRLCTLDELQNECTLGSGCSITNTQMWTSTSNTVATSKPTPSPTTPSPTPSPIPSPTPSPTTPSPTPSPTLKSPTPSPTTPSPTPLPTTLSPTPSPTPSPGASCHYVSKGKNALGSESCEENDNSYPFRCCSDSNSEPDGDGWVRLSGKDGGDCPWAASRAMGVGFDDCPGSKTWSAANQYCMDTGTSNRLCTLNDLQNECTLGTGCSITKFKMWTGTSGGGT
eukprot:m.134048 g.134048  ORF g.134048 m.134048 type:complete len:729 (+) comp29716_c0_seq2:146-2332(+)